MEAEEIHEALNYHYRREKLGVVEAGRCEVQSKFHRPKSGWHIHVQDTKTLRILKLRPVHIKKRVLVRKPKPADPA